MKQHAKIQSAISAVRGELQFTNDEKIKLKKRIASLYIDAEPSTRAGRRAFAELNLAKDELREVLKLETILQTLLGLAKKGSKAAAAEARNIARQEANVAKAREERIQAFLDAQKEIERATREEVSRMRKERLAAEREAMAKDHRREEALRKFSEALDNSTNVLIWPVAKTYTVRRTLPNRVIFKFQ